MGGGAMGGAAAAAVIIQAARAQGVIVRIEPEDFERLLSREESPLVVVKHPAFLSKKFEYLVSHKGLAFYTRSRDALRLPARAEVVMARSIWVPG